MRLEVPTNDSGSKSIIVEVDPNNGTVWVAGDFQKVNSICRVEVDRGDAQFATVTGNSFLDGDNVAMSVGRDLDRWNFNVRLWRTGDPMLIKDSSPNMTATLEKGDETGYGRGLVVRAQGQEVHPDVVVLHQGPLELVPRPAFK